MSYLDIPSSLVIAHTLPFPSTALTRLIPLRSLSPLNDLWLIHSDSSTRPSPNPPLPAVLDVPRSHSVESDFWLTLLCSRYPFAVVYFAFAYSWPLPNLSPLSQSWWSILPLMSGRQKAAAKRTSNRRGKQQRKDPDEPPPEDPVTASSPPQDDQTALGHPPTPDLPPPIVRQTRPRIVSQPQPQPPQQPVYGPYDGEGIPQDPAMMHGGGGYPPPSGNYATSTGSPPVGNYYPASASGHHVPPFREMPPSPKAEQYLQEHPAVTEAPPGNLDSLADGPDGPGSRPPYPYSTIIRYAIEGSPRGMLTLSEIYDVVEARFPFYKTGGAGWK